MSRHDVEQDRSDLSVEINISQSIKLSPFRTSLRGRTCSSVGEEVAQRRELRDARARVLPSRGFEGFGSERILGLHESLREDKRLSSLFALDKQGRSATTQSGSHSRM